MSVPLFLSFLSLSLACICYHEPEDIFERQYLANSVGFTHITHYETTQAFVNEDSTDFTDKHVQKVIFKVGSMGHEDFQGNQKHIIKFVPQTPCALLCLSKEINVTELWTISNQSKFTTRTPVRPTQKFPALYDFLSFLVKKEMPESFDQLEKFTSLERPQCCDLCCTQIIKNMQKNRT